MIKFNFINSFLIAEINKISGIDDQLIDTKTNATDHFKTIESINSLSHIRLHLKMCHTYDCDHSSIMFGM